MIQPALANDEHLVLYNISWELYEHLLELVGERRLRHSYKEGTLEIMSPSKRHDRDKTFLGRLIETLALEWDIDIDGIGSTTLRSRPNAQGLDPDECYYIAHAAESRKHNDFDVSRDPPPDLAVEVDVTNSSVGRLEIYAALGVPEVWRWVDGQLTFYRLSKAGKYVRMSVSKCFPGLPAELIEEALQRRSTVKENQIIREFSHAIRELR